MNANRIRLIAILATGSFIATAAYAAYKCQIDKGDLYFTGKVKTEQGVLLKEYRCPQGHTYWYAN